MAARFRGPRVPAPAGWCFGFLVAIGMMFSLAPPALAVTARSASAVSPDVRSDRTALTAYHEYLRSLVSRSTLGHARDAAFVTAVDTQCPGALSPLNALSQKQVSQVALSALGEEIGGDLAVRYLSEAAKPFARFSETVGSLKWATPTSAETVKRLLAAERDVLGIAPSPLCADARAVAADPKSTPPATKTFLAHYLSASAALRTELKSFLSLLSAFQTHDEHRLITRIDTLVGRFASGSESNEETDARHILRTLGLSV